MADAEYFKEFESIPVVMQTLTLDGEEGKHAATVRRIRAGETIFLTDGRGLRVRCLVTSVATKSLEAEVKEVEKSERQAPVITLVQALAKGDRDEMAIQAGTEIGIGEVIPWQAERSISRWDSAKSIKQVARWQTICDEAAKQSLRSWFPKVFSPMNSAQLVDAVAKFSLVLVLDPTAPTGLGTEIAKRGNISNLNSIAIVVGPEGGISSAELDRLQGSGAVRVNLGSGILRTSTAGVVALSAIQSALGTYR